MTAQNKRREAYRDGLLLFTEGEVIDRPEAVVEVLYDKDGTKVFFAEIKGTTLCAHGDTIEDAIEDAKFKDGREITEEEKAKYREPDFKFSVALFRRLTGACRAGIDQWLKEHDCPKTIRMTLAEFRKAGGAEWADRLEEVLK